VLLGMNAHIRRDLPFVLAAIGLVTEDGETRKHDHDRVNDFLSEGAVDHHRGAAAPPRPELRLAALPLALDEHAIMHAIRLWREEAWRKAELLVAPRRTRTATGSRRSDRGRRGAQRPGDPRGLRGRRRRRPS
jgi:hypothetical protein